MLFPREHGTYGQIAFPLITALAIGDASLSSILLAVAATAGYLAHEGFVVLLGRRGSRARREQGAVAWRSLAIFGGTAAVAGAAGVLTASATARLGCTVALALSALAIVIAWLGHERSGSGEITAGAALASWAIPVSLAGGASWDQAIPVWAIWTILFAAATLSVRGVIARSTRRDPRPAVTGAVALAAASIVVSISLVRSDLVPAATIAGVLPMAALVSVVAIARVSAKHLRRIGWSYIAVSAATMLALIVAFG